MRVVLPLNSFQNAGRAVALFLFACAALAACAPAIPQDLEPASIQITSDREFRASGAPARTSFYTAEGITVAADITWPDPVGYGGVHTAEWQLYQAGRILMDKRANVRLASKPWRLRSHINPESFPAGAYRIALRIDDKPFASLPFQLLASAQPAFPAMTLTDPDCKDAPKATLTPIRFGPPKIPEQAMDKHVLGCAVVAIILDDTGHPSGVRVLAEHPPGFGIGGAAANAAWARLYPPGHGGVTTYFVVHFHIAN